MTLQGTIELLGFGLTAGVALSGLLQYSKAQRWKVSEFIASEMRILFDDTNRRAVCKMLDWDDGTVVIRHPQHDGACKSFPFSKPLVLSSLRAAIDSAGKPVLFRFSKEEQTIRDLFDNFLTALDRCDNYIDERSRLFSADCLRPYLRYYLKIINGNDPYGKSIRNFAEVYEYTGVINLLEQTMGVEWQWIDRDRKQKELAALPDDVPF